jgi:hypothetical protein
MLLLNRQQATTTSTNSEVSSVRPVGRNACCPCGSGAKYKKCCLLRERRDTVAPLPPWVINSSRKLHLFEKYVTKVYGLPGLLGSFRDRRREPTYSTSEVFCALFHGALLRRPSINATEGDLKQADFQKLIGREPEPGTKAFSAEVISNTLDKLDLNGPRDAIEDVIWQAERNKAFREGSYGTLRCVALDGWEPFCSYDRHCPHCLTREVSFKDPDSGEVQKRTQYYHRYVVAMLVGPVLDVVLDIEDVLDADARPDRGEDKRHEGELTAALRLIQRLHDNYGSFIDALVFDALYANGPTMTKLDECGYGGFIVLKKDDNEPLKEALALWQGQGPCLRFYDEEKKEQVELWDVDDIDTLDTYQGKVRVIRAVITKQDGTRKTWCFGIVGSRSRKVGCRTALKIVRSRWHLENTGFCQWVKYWNLGRVYRHTANAILAILLLWMLVFNLLQLFVYRRLNRPRNPKDPCDTIISIVAEMFRDIAAIPEPISWEVLADAATG